MVRFECNDYFKFLDESKSLELLEKVKIEKEKSDTGYYNLPYDSNYLVEEVENFPDSFNEAKNIVVIGIGGSSLGTKAIDSFLKDKIDKKMIFLDNPDPKYLKNSLKNIEKEDSVFIVISKSGVTIETLSIFKYIIKHFNLNFKEDKIIAISDEASPLCKFADENSIKVYTIPKNVGGRFSVFSAVGVVPLTIAGYDTKKLLFGAKNFLHRFLEFKEPHLINKALFLAKNCKTYNENVIFSYSNYLNDFNRWYIQLLAESIGKIDDSGNRVGITPIGLIGAEDQHSFLQLIMDGPRNKTVTFIKIADFKEKISIPDISLKYLEDTDFVNCISFEELLNKECHSTYEAISNQKIPADMITLQSFDEEAIGELMMSFMLLISMIGIELNINTYNQPGVELGKKILKEKFGK